MPKKKPTRGGKRPGAGRPARAPDLHPCKVSLTPAERDHLKQIGGNIQAGVVRLVQESMTRALTPVHQPR